MDYNPQPGGNFLGKAHPILFLGIIIFVIPFFEIVIKKNIPDWLTWVGLFIMFIGAILSLINVLEE